MASVVMTRGGKKLYERAIGYQVIDRIRPKIATPQTRYVIGSITKTFTATMIMQLIEEGKLTLQTRLGKFFPDIQNADQISIDMMLRHRSGIHNFTSEQTFWENSSHFKSRERMLSEFAGLKPDFEPGTKGVYSNTNYVLLGYIIESITAMSYQENLQFRINEKIGLTDTRLGLELDSSNHDAFSYVFTDKWEKAPQTDLSQIVAAGAIISTAHDLTLFIEALFKGKLVSKESLSRMTDIVDMFGIGLVKMPFENKEGFGHTGGIDGFQSVLAYYPSDSFAVAIVSNGVDYPISDITAAMLNAYYRLPVTIPDFASLNLDPALLDTYTGVYTSKQLDIKFTVFRRNRTLLGQADAEPPFILTPYDTNKFRFDAVNLKIEFKPEEHKLIATQPEEVIEFERVRK